MKKETLEVTKREAFGKSNAKKIRNEGLAPGVIYGGDNDPVAITFNPRQLNRLYKTEYGKNVIISVKVDRSGSQKEVDVITKKIDRDVISRDIKHVDFLVLEENKKIVTEVPINIIGVSPGVKKGGVFILKGRTVKLSLLPSKLMAQVDVDISELEIGEDIKFQNLKLDDDIEILTHSLDTIVRVAPPKTQLEEELEEAEAAAAAAEGEEGEEGAEGAEGDEVAEGSSDEKSKSSDSDDAQNEEGK